MSRADRQGCHVDLHGEALYLVLLDRVVNSLISFGTSVDDGYFSLRIMVFELKVDKQSYNVQHGCKMVFLGCN